MSGPVDETKIGRESFGGGAIEVREGRRAEVGGVGIMRVLPTKRRRTIGPWCFVDLIKPDDIERPPRLEIGPHPHIGLATVTWLFAGEVLHSDSLGSQQPILPGELNLMSAGRGIAHAEQGIRSQPADATGGVVGAQMWLAQPDATRHGASRFQHHKDLPLVEMANATAKLLVGGLEGLTSPAEFDHPALGVDIELRGPQEVGVDPDFEHGVIPVDRPIRVNDEIVEPGSVAVVPTGYASLRLESRDGPGRLMLVGGLPLGETVKMWWNFVGRTTDELTQAWRDWQSGDEERFGPVPTGLARIEAPPPPWLRSDG